MSYIKRFMEEVYDEHTLGGMSPEDIAKKHDAPLDLVNDAIELMEEDDE